MTRREQKIAAKLKRLSAEFLGRRAGKQSLVTVTDFALSNSGKLGTVFVTVFPATAEKAALGFAHRHASELRRYVKEHLRIGLVPRLDFAIDAGEKHRQKVEELLQ